MKKTNKIRFYILKDSYEKLNQQKFQYDINSKVKKRSHSLKVLYFIGQNYYKPNNW